MSPISRRGLDDGEESSVRYPLGSMDVDVPPRAELEAEAPEEEEAASSWWLKILFLASPISVSEVMVPPAAASLLSIDLK